MARLNAFAIVLLLSIVGCQSKGSLVRLDEGNWDVMLEGEWMVEFFAPWCPACKSLQPVWAEFASWSEELDVSVAAVDITTSPGLSGRFMITALPTIFHVKDGVFRQYRGARDRDQLISFIEDHKWRDLESVSSWRSPNSHQMSLLSHFFRLSMVLRSVHETLTERYGVPVWTSYLLFVTGTVLVGAVLGLVFVCCIDLFCGHKQSTPPPPSVTTTTTITTRAEPHSDHEPKSDDNEDHDDDDEEEDEEAATRQDAGPEDVHSAEEEEEQQHDDDDVEEMKQEVDDSSSHTTATLAASGSSEIRKRRTRRAD